MTGEEISQRLKDKFGVPPIREGNAIWVNALVKDSKKMVRLVVVLNTWDEVLKLSLYPWHADLDIPGTEKNINEVLEKFV
jgi:hypothetical protein